MKVLILGHGSHGKDTLAEMVAHITSLSFTSSSRAACEKAVFPFIEPKYASIKACYHDRRNHRETWKRLIGEYNTPDKARLIKEVLAEHDIYVGLRCPEEYAAGKHLFSHTFWVDASRRLPLDPSMNIEYDPACMTWVDNNGSKEDFIRNVVSLFWSRSRLLIPA